MRRLLPSALLLALLVIMHGYVFSQTKMKLSGTVSDSTKSLSLVTVRLFKKNNPVPLQTTLSKENGSFQLNKPDTGHYILSFTHTGFAEKRMDIIIRSTDGDMPIEPVQLSKATGMLREVTVITQRPLVEHSNEKIFFNVEDDPSAKTETALDILRKTPFVSVDGDEEKSVVII